MNPWNVGDKVKLVDNVLVNHARSVPEWAGYTHEQFQWRDTLREREGEVGEVTMVFDSGHTNVTFDDGLTIGIEADQLEKTARKKRNSESEKSEGHLGFDEDYEYFSYGNDVYYAPIDSFMREDYLARVNARWYCYLSNWDNTEAAKRVVVGDKIRRQTSKKYQIGDLVVALALADDRGDYVGMPMTGEVIDVGAYRYSSDSYMTKVLWEDGHEDWHESSDLLPKMSKKAQHDGTSLENTIQAYFDLFEESRTYTQILDELRYDGIDFNPHEVFIALENLVQRGRLTVEDLDDVFLGPGMGDSLYTKVGQAADIDISSATPRPKNKDNFNPSVYEDTSSQDWWDEIDDAHVPWQDEDTDAQRIIASIKLGGLELYLVSVNGEERILTKRDFS